MPISVDCSSCGKTLRAKDSAAGKTARCPGCQELLTIPEIEEDYGISEEDLDEFNTPLSAESPGGLPAELQPSRQTCPECGEKVSAKDRRCRYCGERLGDSHEVRSLRESSSREDSPPLADLGKRFLGALADGLAGMVLIGPGMGLMIASNPDAPQPNETLLIGGVIAALVGFLVLFGLQIYLLASRSQTIGKYLVGIQIRDYETGQPAGFVKAFILRSLVNGIIGSLAGCIPLVGGCYSLIDILFIFSEEHRCIHDHIAGTYVADIS